MLRRTRPNVSLLVRSLVRGVEESILTHKTLYASLQSVVTTLERLAIDIACRADQLVDEGWAKPAAEVTS